MEGQRRGFTVEPERIRKQVDFTVASFKTRLESLKKGQGIGGASTTVGYALMALSKAQYPADDLTTAMVHYLVARQAANGSWTSSANRPPTEASPFTTTAVALWGLRAYGPAEKDQDPEAVALRQKVEKAREKGLVWLLRGKPDSTEDHVFRLFGLLAAGADAEDLDETRQVLVKAQRADGGWAQLADLDSDAYATGTVLVALKAAGLPTTDDTYRRGVQFLLKTQRDDGAWLVQTRSRPIQTFFDNGDPGEKSQFISFAATNWALLALLEFSAPKQVFAP
jgi:hypothetical protein